MPGLPDVIDRLEQLMNCMVAMEDLPDATLETLAADWQDAIHELTHRVETEHPEPKTLAACRKRLENVLGRLPEAQANLARQLSETARQLYQENQRTNALEKNRQTPSGRVIYRKA